MSDKRFAIFAIAAAFLAACLLLFYWQPHRQIAPDSEGSTGTSLTIVAPTTGPKVLLEAENFVEIAPPFSVPERTPAGASGKCLYVGPEKWNDNYQKGEIKVETRKGHEAAQYPGYARYEFEVPSTGDYTLWVRAFWVDDCGDSIEVSINGAAPKRLGGSTHGMWTWNRLSLSEGGPVLLRLEAGKTHTLVICNREDDLYLDQILLRGADRHWPDPVGIEKP